MFSIAQPIYRQMTRRRSSIRRGAATVEFAFTAPLFVLVLLGICEMGRSVNASSQLTSAVREAGRLACMDFKDLVPSGMTANQKIENDIRAFLNASGFPGDEVTISITHAEGTSQDQVFDLENPDNYLELLRITASLPYESVSSVPLMFMRDKPISATIVFRRGRVNMSQ
jgi:Flp pilus assembly protein TadG